MMALLLFFGGSLLAGCRGDGPAVDQESLAGDQATPAADVSGAAGADAVSAMAVPSPTPLPTAVPSPTPAPPKEIVVCMSAAPASLYLYANETPVTTALRHAIYENLFTSLGYDYQPQGLEKLPSLADGDAVINTVTVGAGELVNDVTNAVVRLAPGVVVRNLAGERVVFEGEPLELPQMVVDFTFKPLRWSDGTPVTAADSVFSFQVAASPQTPGRKTAVFHTASYTATGARSVRWVGVPGYLDPAYFTNVWMPLPSHQLAQYTPVELQSVAEANRAPLSTGPFVVGDWSEPDRIVLVPNPHYYRAAEGLPRLDKITLRFGAAAAWLNGDQGCDLITRDALSVADFAALQSAAADGAWTLYSVPGLVYEHLNFGVNPVSVYAEGRPDWFEDARMRQAIAQCIDRQRMVDELTAGQGALMHAYVPPGHPLYPPDLAQWSYDPVAANALLDELGYLDFAGDGRRQDVFSGVPFTVTLGTNSESDLRLRLNDLIQENLRDCGIAVELYDLPAGTWFADGPRGVLFGRRFDLAAFSWLTRLEPDCGLFLSENVTGPLEFGFGGWRNLNVSGWSNAAYDEACRAALLALPGQPGRAENHAAALRIFVEELPMLPLFTNVKLAVARPHLLNFAPDSSQPSGLWNVAEWDLALDQ